MRNTDDVIEIDLQELFGLLLHWLWLIVACGVIAGMAGFCVSSFFITPQYESTTKVYILSKQDSGNITYSDMQLGTQLTKDYAQLIKSRDVLEQVIETFELAEEYDNFSERIEVENLTDTRIIAITVRDESPEMAQQIANEIRSVAALHIKNVMDIEAVNVAEEANLPKDPASPSILKWTAIGGLIGIFLCAVVIVVRFLMDDTIKTGDDVEKYLGLSTLAMIPVIEEPDKKKSAHRRHLVPEKDVEIIDMDKDGTHQKSEDEEQVMEQTELKSDAKPEHNPEKKTEAKPESNSEVKSETKQENTANGKHQGRNK